MYAFYPQIKLLHIGTVLVSGAVFASRGLLMLGRSPACNHPLLKRFSYINDSVLLIAGLLLMNLGRQYPTTAPWLAAKLSLLLVYIALGIMALRPGRSYTVRATFFAAALGTYLFILSIARGHTPWGFLATGTVW